MCTRDQFFFQFSIMYDSGHKENAGKLAFSLSKCIVPLFYSWFKAIIIRQLDRNEPISPAANIVTKLLRSVGDVAVNVLCSRNCR